MYRVRRRRTRGEAQVEDVNWDPKPGQTKGDPLLARAAAVYDVATDELTLSHEDVERMLRERTLRSTDLIFIGDVWTTLADSIPFAEAALPAAKREARVRWLIGAGTLGLIALVYALILWLRLSWRADWR